MMLPKTGDDLDLVALTVKQQPSHTHKLDMDRARVRGMADGREAVRQGVYLALNVERYAYPIYSRNYGVELSDLIGMPKDYAMSEIRRRITEALMQDDRIIGLDNWVFETGKNRVWVSFTVQSIYGELDGVTKEVEI